jgi:hypothetical protein
MRVPLPRTRKLTIIAQDPSITDMDGNILLTEIEIPAEELSPGPRGYRVHVVDYDTSTDTLYKPQRYEKVGDDNCYIDPFSTYTEKGKTGNLLHEPGFHAQNVYAIVMRTLARFEFALGRRVSWGFDGHQLYVAPHAFADANAFYSESDQALAFGYFRVPGENGDSQTIFTCLSHDVVAHETTHAILDGLRQRYKMPSSPEQAGFHEGFSDVVALLSVFSLKDVVRTLLLKFKPRDGEPPPVKENYVSTAFLNERDLGKSVLLGLADQMGEALSGVRGRALRRSVDLLPLGDKDEPYLERAGFNEPHKCGELLVAAIMDAFLQVWVKRMKKYISERREVDIAIVVDEGADAADQLLTMAIRALDYMPPTDILFSDYLSAMLTSDRETVPDDSKYGYRKTLRDCFAAYGIKPAGKGEGYWQPVNEEFSYDRTHFDSLLGDRNEIFRFIWDNRKALDVASESTDYYGKAYMNVQSVRPCLRIGPDGFAVRETVAEYVQRTTLRFDELEELGISGIGVKIPKSQAITLYGSGTLIFDEYGRLKFHIQNRIFSDTKQPGRIEYLWRYGFLKDSSYTENMFSKMHLNRVLSTQIDYTEGF